MYKFANPRPMFRLNQFIYFFIIFVIKPMPKNPITCIKFTKTTKQENNKKIF